MATGNPDSSTSPTRVLLASLFWQTDLIDGVARHAAVRGWHLNLEMLISGKLPDKWDGDGIIAQSPLLSAELRRRLARKTCPAVALSLLDPEIDIPRVGIDNPAAGEMAAKHFLEKRFTQFAFYAMASAGDPTTARLLGFSNCLKKQGYAVINLSAAKKSGQAGDWYNRIGQLRRKLRAAPKPLAVFAIDDRNAADIIEACQIESISIPEEVAVLGMLNIPLYGQATGVALSSISVDFDTHARIACDLLDRLMRGKKVSMKPILLPPTGIVARKSTETVATHIQDVTLALKFMQKNYQKPITVHNIAQHVGTSYTNLCRLFAADLGEPPYAVLNKMRVDFAKRMLAGKEPDLASIAESCGFGDRVNLHRNFVRYTGKSPGAYRKAHLNKS